MFWVGETPKSWKDRLCHTSIRSGISRAFIWWVQNRAIVKTHFAISKTVFFHLFLYFFLSLSLSLSLSHTTFFLAALFLSRCFHSLPLLPFSPAPSFLSRSFFPLFFFCIHSSCTAFSFPLGGGRYTVDRGLLRKLSKTPSPTGVVWGRKPDGGKLQCKPSPGK